MKKIILTLVAVLSMTTAFAENENMNATNAYSLNINMKSLARSLKLSADQMDAVEAVTATFKAEMLNAAAADKQERKELVSKAVNRDLSYMRIILDEDQFRAYRVVLNATFVNRGITME